MTEEVQVLKIVTGRLDAAGIPYMVTGSMALNYYAVPRMTRDIVVRKDTEYRRTELARRRRVRFEGHPFFPTPPAVPRA